MPHPGLLRSSKICLFNFLRSREINFLDSEGEILESCCGDFFFGKLKCQETTLAVAAAAVTVVAVIVVAVAAGVVAAAATNVSSGYHGRNAR